MRTDSIIKTDFDDVGERAGSPPVLGRYSEVPPVELDIIPADRSNANAMRPISSAA
jgi:hypothetical protein